MTTKTSRGLHFADKEGHLWRDKSKEVQELRQMAVEDERSRLQQLCSPVQISEKGQRTPETVPVDISVLSRMIIPISSGEVKSSSTVSREGELDCWDRAPRCTRRASKAPEVHTCGNPICVKLCEGARRKRGTVDVFSFLPRKLLLIFLVIWAPQLCRWEQVSKEATRHGVEAHLERLLHSQRKSSWTGSCNRCADVTGCCWELRNKWLHAKFTDRPSPQWVAFSSSPEMALPVKSFPLFQLLPSIQEAGAGQEQCGGDKQPQEMNCSLEDNDHLRPQTLPDIAVADLQQLKVETTDH
eukprot:s4362_g2.t1